MIDSVFEGETPRISQYFGENPQIYKQFGLKGHDGIDVACKTGTPLFSVLTGKVQRVQDQGKKGYGLHVRLENDFYVVIYGHLSKVFVKQGDNVVFGQKIGDSGNTGFSTGAHLHFEVRPKPIISSNGFAGATNPLSIIYDKYIDFCVYNGIFKAKKLRLNDKISRYEMMVVLERFSKLKQ